MSPAARARGKATAAPVTINGHALGADNADKVLFPRDGLTKGDLVAYYRPWRGDPPVSARQPADDGALPRRHRCDTRIWEKQLPRYTPDWVHRVTTTPATGAPREVTFLVCDDEATLVWIANLAAITLHLWFSHQPTLDTPDLVLFDLDPGRTVPARASGARRARLPRRARVVGLRALVKTTGGMGLHLSCRSNRATTTSLPRDSRNWSPPAARRAP